MIRDVAPADLDALLAIRVRSFGHMSAGEAEEWKAKYTLSAQEGLLLGAYDGSRIMAGARIADFRQWWYGRPLTCAGIAGVVVAPEDRGKGVARTMIRAVVERAAALGYPVSALYPSTTPLYRSCGWEHAGARHYYVIPTESLRSVRPAHPVALRRMGPGDAAEVMLILHRVYSAARASGPVCATEVQWRQWLGDDRAFLYIADDGFIVYRWAGDALHVDHLAAASEHTARTLWGLLGSTSSTAKSIRAALDPADPVFHMLGERGVLGVALTPWMMRVVDLPTAVSARGYPTSVTADLTLDVDDPVRPGNTGLWRLTFTKGEGTAEPARPADSATHVGVGAFSALYAGVPTDALRRSGLLTGGSPADDEVLDTVFAARPYMIDHF
ncbi:GNAT family N-acetyltransferase [Sinosporangium siamense]|nr:GNAT family N-acetyltransferase [Sinosporangium siamense]